MDKQLSVAERATKKKYLLAVVTNPDWRCPQCNTVLGEKTTKPYNGREVRKEPDEHGAKCAVCNFKFHSVPPGFVRVVDGEFAFPNGDRENCCYVHESWLKAL